MRGREARRACRGVCARGGMLTSCAPLTPGSSMPEWYTPTPSACAGQFQHGHRSYTVRYTSTRDSEPLVAAAPKPAAALALASASAKPRRRSQSSVGGRSCDGEAAGVMRGEAPGEGRRPWMDACHSECVRERDLMAAVDLALVPR